MIKNWNLAKLCQKGMKYLNAAAEEEKISGCKVNKAHKHKFYRCDSPFSTKHIKKCKALKAKCCNCKKQVILSKFVNRKM